MRVMVIVKATADSEGGIMPTTEAWEAMGRFNEDLAKAGIVMAADGLRPSSAGCRIRFDGDDRTVTKGPFKPAGELVAGFWIWQVKDVDEAISWVKRCPNPMPGPSEIEIRPFFEPSDFASLTQEIARQDAARGKG